MANKSTRYVSDEEKRSYYVQSWDKRCKEAGISDEDPEHQFMSILISEINDVENRKTKYKLNYNREELMVIIFAFLSAIFSGLLSIFDCAIWKNIFSILGILTSALIAAINSYRIWKSTKEVWLRCSSYRAKLTLEIDAFCDDIGPYRTLEDSRDKIYLFKENINTLRKEDYSKFFVNMGSDFC